jgi:hypothetical protein
MVKWNRLADGSLCFSAPWPEHRPRDEAAPAACMPRLRADEITFSIRRQRLRGRPVFAGLKGSHVKAVRVRLLYPTRTWSPPTKGGVFYGQVPSGTVTAVVKVLDAGTTKTFSVHAHSK